MASSEETRRRLLAAAEELFAERGYDAVSVRDVTRRAKANLAAVGYHFGSKEALFVEALRARARALNARRIAALDAVLAGSRQPKLRDILDAFARAMVEDVVSGRPEGTRLHRLVTRAFAEADTIARALFRQEMLPVALRFVAAIGAACPGIPKRRAGLGLALYAGSLVHALRWADKPPLPELGAEDGPPSLETLMSTLVDFGEAGFRALGARGRGRVSR